MGADNEAGPPHVAAARHAQRLREALPALRQPPTGGAPADQAVQPEAQQEAGGEQAALSAAAENAGAGSPAQDAFRLESKAKQDLSVRAAVEALTQPPTAAEQSRSAPDQRSEPAQFPASQQGRQPEAQRLTPQPVSAVGAALDGQPAARKSGGEGKKASATHGPVQASTDQAANTQDEGRPAASKNTIFTEEAAAAARARLKAKLSQLNAGIDPEMLMDGITLAGYHIERGARTFAAYAKAMVEDLGEAAKPFLKSWYLGAKYDPRAAGFEGMSSAAEVDAADVDALLAQEAEQSNETGAEPQAEIKNDLDAAAHEAATSPLNDLPQPTEKQKAAENYKVGRVRLHGMDISIENPRGSVRSGVSPDGTRWQNTLAHHYGRILGSTGAGGDHVDVFLTDGAEDAPVAWVIDQKNEDGSFDEHKVVIGPRTEEEARAAYLANYEAGRDGLGAITSMPMEAFRAWVLDGKTKRKPLAYRVPEAEAPSGGKGLERAAEDAAQNERAIAEAWGAMSIEARTSSIVANNPRMITGTRVLPTAEAKRLAALPWSRLPDDVKDRARPIVELYLQKSKPDAANRPDGSAGGVQAGAASSPVSSAPFASFKQMKTALKITGDVDAIKARLRDLNIAFVVGNGFVNVPNKLRWSEVRANIPVRIETHWVEGVPARFADVTVEVMESGAAVARGGGASVSGQSVQEVLDKWIEAHKDSPAQTQASMAEEDPARGDGVQPGNERQRAYIPASKVDTPTQSDLATARKFKKYAYEKIKRLREQIKAEPVGGRRNALRLELLKAEDRYKEYQRMEQSALRAIEEVANQQGKTTVRPVASKQGAQEAEAKTAQDDFVRAPDGSIDFGEITPEMVQAMRLQAGKIRLERGDKTFGLQHIEDRHGAQIRRLGFDSVESFVFDAAQRIEAVWKPDETRQIVVLQSAVKGEAVFIELKPADSGDYYTINTAFPVSDGYAEKKKGWALLWSDASVPAVASGANPLAGAAPDAGEPPAMTPGQSSTDNIAQQQREEPASQGPRRDPTDNETPHTDPRADESGQSASGVEAVGRADARQDAHESDPAETAKLEPAKPEPSEPEPSEPEPAKPALPPGRFAQETIVVTKRGRKWLEGRRQGKSYSVKIEINEASRDFEPGKAYTFPAMVNTETNGYGTSTTIYPLTAEQADFAKRQVERPELLRWLGYVEDKAPQGYVYQNGVDRLNQLGIAKHPDLQARLDAAIAKARQVSAEQAAQREAQRDRAWSERSKARANRMLYPLSAPPVLNKPVRMDDRVVVFTGRGEPFRINDGHPSAFGSHLLGHEGERGAYFYFREASDEEAAQLAQSEARAAEADAARQRRQDAIRKIKDHIQKEGERPDGMVTPQGRTVLDTATAYGGGDWFVIGDEAIWYVRNNGGDGDNWSENNVRTGGAGAIGWRIPFDADIAAELDALDRENTRFRFTDPDPAAAGWGGISRTQADDFVREFVARFPAAPQIVVVSRFDQLPERLQQDARQQNGGEGSVKGAFSQRDGRVYIVAGNHRSLADLEATVLHETIGHAGVRRMFGQQWVQKLNQLYIALGGDGGIIGVMLRRGMGDQLSAYYHGIAAARKANPERWTDDLARAVLTEEVLAHIAEQQGRPSLRDRFMTLVGAVRQWLRDMGFTKLASMGESDLLFILSRARAEMRRGDTRIVRDGVQIGPREWVTQDGRAIPKGDPDYAHAVRLAKLLGLEERSGTTVFRFDDAEIAQQFADTERAYGGREAFERARAAGRTKLGYRQWVQVRTPAFKQWFGDWEALRAQRRLDAMEPVQVRMPDEWIGLSHAELRQRVADALDAMVRERATVMHPELGEIRVGRAGQRKTVAEGRDPAKLLISADLQNVLPKAVHAVSEAADGQNVLGYAKLLAKVRVGSADLVAVFAVREQSDGHWYYNTVAVQDAQKQTPDESGAATAGPARDATPDGEGHPLLTAVEDFVRRPLKRVNPGSVSKVVDPDTGEPMVVYHGAFADFSTFGAEHAGEITDGRASSESYAQTAKVGFWFNTNPTAGDKAGYTVDMPVFLAIKNPHREMSLDWLAQGLEGTTGLAYRDDLIAEGYDGIVLQDEEMGGTSYVAFRPEQIKSATGNRGAFDPADPGILNRRAEPAAAGMTPGEFRAALVTRFGENGVAALEAQGLLNITVANEADPLAGWYDPESKQAFFVPELIGSADEAVALVLHEVGEHHGLEAMLGPRAWRTLKARIAGLARDGKNDIRAAWDGVIDNYPEFHHLAGARHAQRLREALPALRQAAMAGIESFVSPAQLSAPGQRSEPAQCKQAAAGKHVVPARCFFGDSPTTSTA